MTLKQLQSKLNEIRFSGYGHYNVSFDFRNKSIAVTTTNTQAIDRYHDDNDGIDNNKFYTTKKRALYSLYRECVNANK